MIMDIYDYFRPRSSWKMSMERQTVKPNDVLILLLSHASVLQGSCYWKHNSNRDGAPYICPF